MIPLNDIQELKGQLERQTLEPEPEMAKTQKPTIAKGAASTQSLGEREHGSMARSFSETARQSFPPRTPTVEILKTLKEQGLHSFVEGLSEQLPTGYALKDFLKIETSKNVAAERTEQTRSHEELSTSTLPVTLGEVSFFEHQTELDPGRIFVAKNRAADALKESYPKTTDLTESIVCEYYSQKYECEIFAVKRGHIAPQSIKQLTSILIEKLDQHNRIGILSPQVIFGFASRDVHTVALLIEKVNDDQYIIRDLNSSGSLAFTQSEDPADLKIDALDPIRLLADELSASKDATVKIKTQNMPRQSFNAGCAVDALQILKEALRKNNTTVTDTFWNPAIRGMAIPSSMMKTAQTTTARQHASEHLNSSYSSSKPDKTLGAHMDKHSVKFTDRMSLTIKNWPQNTDMQATTDKMKALYQVNDNNKKLLMPEGEIRADSEIQIVSERNFNFFVPLKAMQYAKFAMDFLASLPEETAEEALATIKQRRLIP